MNRNKWQDWTVLVLGALLALTPFWYNPGTTGAVWAMVIVGVLLVGASLWSFARPEAESIEWAHALVGAVAFLSPWLFSFTGETGAAWTSWIVGAAAVVFSLWAVPRIEHMFHRTATPH